MKNEKTNKLKAVLITVSYILLFVLIVGLCLQVFGTGKVKPSEWFNSSEAEPETETADGGMILTPDESNNKAVQLSLVSTFSEEGEDSEYESTQTLTVSVEPDFGIYPAFDWSVAWANAENSWASNKTVTDYVTVVSDSLKTAVVGCKQAFGAQIIVTVSVPDTELSATCTVDYMKRILGVTEETKYQSSTAASRAGWNWTATYNIPEDAIVPFNLGSMTPAQFYTMGVSVTSQFNLVFSVGTKYPSITSMKYSVDLSPRMKYAGEQYTRFFGYGNTQSCGFTSSETVRPLHNFINDTDLISNQLYPGHLQGFQEQFFYFEGNPVNGYKLGFLAEKFNTSLNNLPVLYLGTMFPSILEERASGTTFYESTSRCLKYWKYLLQCFVGFYNDASIVAEDKYTFTRKVEVVTGSGETQVFKRKYLVKYQYPIENISLNFSDLVF